MYYNIISYLYNIIQTYNNIIQIRSNKIHTKAPSVKGAPTYKQYKINLSYLIRENKK